MASWRTEIAATCGRTFTPQQAALEPAKCSDYNTTFPLREMYLQGRQAKPGAWPPSSGPFARATTRSALICLCRRVFACVWDATPDARTTTRSPPLLAPPG